VLDAQYFDLAQRRERVFFVGHLGDWRGPAAVLLEPEGLRGNHPPSHQAGERAAGTIKRSLERCSADEAECDTLIAFGGNNTEGPIDLATACRAKGGTGHGDFESETFIASLRADGFDATVSAVRRLTPRECERLQGFPNDYTLVAYRGKLAADGPRYKALGNSMAVPVIRWILERIEAVDLLLSYDGAGGHDDFAKSFHMCLEAVRERQRAGGEPWVPA
jgi:DNA (cytosine-5)-methyltransferase 1